MSPDAAKPSVDVVVATLGRTGELARLVASVGAQSLDGVRLIVVDQNEDDRLASVLAQLPSHVSLLHLHSERGLSRARNVALQHLVAEVVTFADDDCWYAPDLLERVVSALEARPEDDGISVALLDEGGAPSSGRWDTAPGAIDRRNVWRRATSCTIFLRRRVVEAVGFFDEELGAGSGTEFGSGEETDYLLRALELGLRFWYDPSLAVFHPQSRLRHDTATIAAGRGYGMGMGRVLRKHRYSLWFAAYHCGRALGGSILSWCRKDPGAARFHWAVARGRASGWRRGRT
jgi:GT2 family glycosyltransferase